MPDLHLGKMVLLTRYWKILADENVAGHDGDRSL